ncbi:DUF7529 family protein [Halovenus salina]|uniref:Uncharacterized protein n=1 Tax=Halovenus salina TaxID=1510225 RepID=A0ABD5W4S3_9EURY|nr:hypothetical protein [Halovenus salina]
MTDDATNEGWVKLLDEMDAMAAEFDEDGWETLSMAAGDAAPVGPEEGQTDHHGYSYVVPGDAADRFAELFDSDGFPRTEVYRAATPSHLFLLTVVLDPATETAILVAGALDRSELGTCQEHAEESGRTYTHLLRVDGTHLGSFEHADPEPFFPAE